MGCGAGIASDKTELASLRIRFFWQGVDFRPNYCQVRGLKIKA